MLQSPLLPAQLASLSSITTAAVFVFVFILLTRVLGLGQSRVNRNKHGVIIQNEPPRLGETIPFVSNTWQFMTNKGLFISRARQALKTSPVVTFRLGPMKINLVTGGTNVSAIFRSSFSSEPWVMRIMAHGAGYSPSDLAKISLDDSGSSTQPRSSATEYYTNPDTRIWHAMHTLYDRTMISSRQVELFARRFRRLFFERVGVASPVTVGSTSGEWDEDVRIYGFLQQTMAHAATEAVHGPLILDLNPDFIDTFWEYEKHVERLAFGLPTWMNRPAVRARDNLSDMCRRWFEVGDARFDWTRYHNTNGAEDEDDWEPIFGSAVSRGLILWAKKFGFTNHTVGAVFILFLFGLHANTVPVCAWVLMELVKDAELWHAVKEEVRQAEAEAETEAETDAEHRWDPKKLTNLPLLTSIYTEVLRLHVGVLITRTAHEDVTVGGYTFPRGSIFQAPTEVAHLDEDVWGKPGHPATEFWAYRHIKETPVQDENGNVINKLSFSLGGRPGSFFPFGGGQGYCVGRNMAKAEVFAVVATIVSSYEVEFVEWINENGSSSERPARNDLRYANSVAAPPDRDMKVRWRRVR